MLVICNGMMRSGSTLQYNLASALLELRGPLHRLGFKGGFKAGEAPPELCGYRDSAEAYILKTHDAPLPLDFYGENTLVLYSFRDVRDVAASMSKKWKLPFDEVLGHVESSLVIHADMAAVPGVLRQPYPLLLGDLPIALDEIAAHLGASPSASERAAILAANTVDAVDQALAKKRQNRLRQAFGRVLGRLRIDRTSLLHDDHISASRGQDGDWAKVFNADEIARLEHLIQSHDYRVA